MNQRYLNVIRHYRNWKAAHPDIWVEHAASQATLHDAISIAGNMQNHLGKLHPHQYRLEAGNMQNYAESLHTYENDLRAARSFDDIMVIANDARVHGIGDLAIYDTAVRVGSFLNIWPQRVYLHADARAGVGGLINNLSTSIITRDQLPDEFNNSDLSCYELEDIYVSIKRSSPETGHKEVKWMILLK